MKCPNCDKAEVKEQISIKGLPFFKKKEICYYCPLCDFEKIKTFKLSKEDIDLEMIERNTKINSEYERARNTKEKIETKNTSYNQRFKKE
jgi:hypothetical protein